MNTRSANAQPPTAPLKRYRVLNSVGRRLFASFDTEEEAFGFIMDQPGPSCRFAFEDGQAPALAPEIDQIQMQSGLAKGFAAPASTSGIVGKPSSAARSGPSPGGSKGQ